MSFSDHKITQFTHKIADLPDQPNMPADELKTRFDSSPEELRQSVNGICDDADRLEARVEGIVAETFGDTIDKSMLSDELAAELDAKAVESSVASRITAEQTARESADADLQDQIDDHTDALAEKVEVYTGVFDPTGGTVTINLPFSPKAVLVVPNGGSLIPKLILPRTDHFAVGETGYCGDLNGNVLSLYRSLTTDAGYYHFYIAFA